METISNIKKYVLMAAIFISGGVLPVAAVSDADSCAVKVNHRLGLDLRGAYVAGARKNIRDIYPGGEERDAGASAHLKYSFSYTEATRQGRLYPGAYQGIGVAANTFFAPANTGTPVCAYLFQGAPIFKVAEGLTFDYEWNFGASFGWKKYNPDYTPLNLVVGSPVNAYINMGLMLRYRLTPHWSLAAGVDMAHYSNGNTSWPNPGVNTIGGRVGVTYTFDATAQTRTLTDGTNIEEPVRPHLSYDVVIYGAVRKKMDGSEVLPGHFGIGGLNFAPMYNFNRFLRAGVSLDVQYDESSGLKPYWVEGTYGDDIKFYRPPFFRQVSWGLSARGELVMPIFSINAGIGYNIIGNSDAKNFYQVLALKAHLTKSFFLHIGYQLNSFKNPNNLMIGVGYRFHDLR
ncbi:MAG: acyloxyacyl hydrolase [Staphylococcus sp.]|nr:acyloxyacyl hydrolase [Staphylococcus sp.]